MPPCKALRLADSVDGLNKLIKMPDLRNKTLVQLCNSARTVTDAAEKAISIGDEEMVYVYLMKYFDVMSHIKKAARTPDDKTFVKLLLGANSRQFELLDLLEKTRKRLIERYENRFPSVEPPKNDENGNSTVSDMNEAVAPKMSVTCQELHRMMEDPGTSMLIIDCRPKADFDSTHLVYADSFNLGEHMIQKGLTGGKIAASLMDDAKRFWAKRNVKDNVILMDWDSVEASFGNNSTIWILRDVLLNWDPDGTYSNSIQIVEGGYENFQLMYPMKTHNPSFKRKVTRAFEATLNDVEYPSWEAIKLKDTTYPGTPTQSFGRRPPGVDRSTKPSSGSELERKPINSLYDEKLQLLEKEYNTQHEAMNREADLGRMLPKEDEIIDNNKIKEFDEQAQHLSFKNMQIDNEQNDNKLQMEQLDEELEGRKIEENVSAESEQERRIREKQQSIQALEQERKKLEARRELFLRVARETKRRMKLDEEDEIKAKQHPVVDRSVKPPTALIQRDFNPVVGMTVRGMTGLKNLGNTCYMNSIIQCLANVEFLSEYLRQDLYRKQINRKTRTQGRIVEEFAALVQELWKGQYKSISPRDFRQVLGDFEPTFRGYEQQDSHELLTILMDLLHLDLQTIAEENIPQNKLLPAEQAWRDFVNHKESYILKLFYGQIKSTVKCRVCQEESSTYEGFSNLSLELPPTNSRCELKDCLDMYFDGELISGWNCPRCKVPRDAVKKLDMSKLPPYLVIHLKRFYADDDSGCSFKKKQNYIKFPLEKLNVSGYMTRQEKHQNPRQSYNLCSVSNHYGSMDRGHYTAFCKNFETRNWCKFDDHEVNRMDRSDVISSAAYILVYSSH